MMKTKTQSLNKIKRTWVVAINKIIDVNIKCENKSKRSKNIYGITKNIKEFWKNWKTWKDSLYSFDK